MEDVTILKRGQGPPRAPPLASEDRQPLVRDEAAGGGDVELGSTGRLGPDPEVLPKQIRIMDQKPPFYTGSGFLASPPPSSVPLPTSLFTENDGGDGADLATKALRCLLLLDLP